MNETIFFFFYELAHQSPLFDQVVTFVAVYFIYIVIVLAITFLLFHHDFSFSWSPIRESINKFKEFILLFLSAGLAWVLANKVLKVLIHTPRPFDVFPEVQSLFAETGYAFPSGHTSVAAAVAFALFLNHRKTGYVFIFLALVIGIARIISGVHFPIDILGGFVVGALVALICRFSFSSSFH